MLGMIFQTVSFDLQFPHHQSYNINRNNTVVPVYFLGDCNVISVKEYHIVKR